MLHDKLNDIKNLHVYIWLMDIKQEIGHRLRAAREELGLNLREVAEQTKSLKASTISNYEQGLRMPGPQEIWQLAHALKKNPAYLMCLDESYWDIAFKGTTEGELLRTLFSEIAHNPKDEVNFTEKFVLVPRYNVTASMGPGAAVDSEQVVDYLSFKRSWIEREHFKPDSLALIDSRGDSMMPTINPGDLLLIDHSPMETLTDGIYVLNLEGDLLAKRIERQFDGSLRIMSDNPRYAPQTIAQEDIKKLTVVGRVVWAGGRM